MKTLVLFLMMLLCAGNTAEAQPSLNAYDTISVSEALAKMKLDYSCTRKLPPILTDAVVTERCRLIFPQEKHESQRAWAAMFFVYSIVATTVIWLVFGINKKRIGSDS